MPRIILLLILFTLAPIPSHAAENFGLGIILGEPTGFSAQYKLQNQKALDFALAYSFGNSILILADYVWIKPKVFNSNDPFIKDLDAFLGVGGILDFHDKKNGSSEVRLAARIPVGLSYRIPKTPIDVGVEIAPGLRVIPSTDFIVQGGIFGRFFFP